jgi:hypothetical protein
VPETMSLDLNIDRERLEQTFKKLIERHESLKTFFEMIEGKPVQRVRKNVGFGIEYKDAGSFDAPREIIEYFGRPFDLAQPPLIRVGIIETDHAYILILNMHHIITDGVSMEVARKEFMSLYNEEQLPPLRIQYKDYTIWQNRPEIKEKRKKQEEFWLKEYEGDVPVLNMPYDYERPAQRSFEGERIRFVIGEKLPGKLKEMSRQTGATLYMILLAAFYILLCKYTRQEDIIVGSPVTGRNHADLENIIGLFINMIALRNRPERNKIFRHFLMEVKEKVVDALENQEYPFEELVVQLGLQGDPSRNPLFDVVFSLVVPNLETPEEDRDRPGDNNQSKTILNELEYKITNFDLIMGAVEKKGIIEITIAYATALYNRSTIEKMAEHYTDILKQVSNNDEIKLRDILISHNLIAVDPGIPGEDQEEFKF